jgi:D-alanyl-D-alanine carboxypeptidase
MKSFWWFLLVLLLTAAATTAAAGLTEDLQALLNKTLEENPQVPGLSLYIICPQLDLEWSGAAGMASRNSEESLTAQHTFRMASNAKTYVAAAILRLVEMNRLSLDDPLEKHLPQQWRQWLADDGYDLQAITLRMVLSHTAGLNDHASDDRYPEAIVADPQRQWLPDDQIHLLTQWFDPVGRPGEKFSYSDDGYIILGRILEQTTGLALGPAVRSLLDFEYLGLDVTWWEIMETKPAAAGPVAHQYFLDFDTTFWNPSFDLYGGGGLMSDARDLGLFTRKLIKGEVLKTEEMLMEMTGSGTADYRLGLFCSDLNGRLSWGHTGFWNTFVFHLPSLDLTISGCILDRSFRGVQLAEDVLGLVEQHR